MTARAWCLVLVIACVLSAALGAYASHRWDTRRSVPVQVAHAATVRTEQRAARVDTIYRQAVGRDTRWRTKWDTLRVRDTVMRDSIVYVRRDVADSTVRACRSVASTCALKVALLDSVIVRKDAEIRATQADRPSLLHRVVTDAAWLAVGYVAGRAGIGAGVSLRVPIR